MKAASGVHIQAPSPPIWAATVWGGKETLFSLVPWRQKCRSAVFKVFFVFFFLFLNTTKTVIKGQVKFQGGAEQTAL